MRQSIAFLLFLMLVANGYAQKQHDLEYWEFNDSINIPKWRIFYTVLPVSEIIVPPGIFSIAQSTTLDCAPVKAIKLTGEYRYQLLGLEYCNILRGGLTVFPFKRVIKKEFPIELKTSVVGYDGRQTYISQKLTYKPINLLQKHGIQMQIGRYSLDVPLELKRGYLYVPDSGKTYNVQAYFPFGKRVFMAVGYKYERSRSYQYRTSEDRKHEKQYLKRVFTNSQVGFDLVKNLSKFDQNQIQVDYGDHSKFDDSPLPSKIDTYNFYQKRLNSIGFKLYWEKEISYWYQKNWGFRFGFEYFQGMALVKGSGMMMMRFGAFGYFR